MSVQPPLRRSLGLPLLVLYGLGTTIGAGIYALTGEVAAIAGYLAPAAFLLASVLAAFTAFSFAELCARFPRAAGEAVYVTAGLRLPGLGTLVGLLVVLAAAVSSAALINSFVGHLGHLGHLVTLPPGAVTIALVLVLVLTAAWGITESVSAAALLTVIEVFGLLLVIGVAGDRLVELPARIGDIGVAAGSWTGVLGASLLAFYAFLGFEDMVNVAEEVRDVERTMPRAITVTLAITAALYIMLSLVAVSTVPPRELGESAAPLALVYERATGRPGGPITGIALFAIINGVLIQTILAARVLYGLSSQGRLPAWLGHVNPRTRTPVRATLLVGILVLVLALWFPLAPLAEATSTITLSVFALVNLALWRLKKRESAPPATWHVPYWLPVGGFWISLGFVGYGVVHLLAEALHGALSP